MGIMLLDRHFPISILVWYVYIECKETLDNADDGGGVIN